MAVGQPLHEEEPLAEADPDEVQAKAKRAPTLPSQDEIDRHELTLTFRRGVGATSACQPKQRMIRIDMAAGLAASTRSRWTTCS